MKVKQIISIVIFTIIGSFPLFSNDLSLEDYINMARRYNKTYQYNAAKNIYSQLYTQVNTTAIAHEYLIFAITQRDYAALDEIYTSLKESPLIYRDMFYFLTDIKNKSDKEILSYIKNIQVTPNVYNKLYQQVIKLIQAIVLYNTENRLPFETALNKLLSQSNQPNIYNYIYAITSIYYKDYITANIYLDKINNNNMLSSESILLKAKVLSLQDKNEEAIEYLFTYISEPYLEPKELLRYTTHIEISNLRQIIQEIIYKFIDLYPSDILLKYQTSEQALIYSLLAIIPDKQDLIAYDSAMMNYNIKNYSMSLEDFKKVRPQTLYYNQAYLKISELLSHHSKELLKYFQKHQKYNYKNPNIFLEVGQNLYNDEQYKKAIIFFKQARYVSNKTNYTLGQLVSNNLLGKAYLHIKRYKKAHYFLKQAMNIDDSDPILINSVAYTYIEDPKSSAKEIEYAISLLDPLLDSNNIDIIDSYAWGLFKLNKYSEALVYIQKVTDVAIQKRLHNYIYFLHHALILEKLNKPKEALKYFELAFYNNPTNKKDYTMIKNKLYQD